MAEANLELKVEQQGTVAIVTLNGPVDSATHDEFKNTLDPLFARPAPHVVLDCAGMTYINARAWRCWPSIIARPCWTAVDGGVQRESQIVAPSICWAGKVLRCFDTREQALAAMQT
jgi:hypothetical protein